MQAQEKFAQIFSIIKGLNRLTVLRGILETPVLKAYNAMLTELLNGDHMGAEKTYHKLVFRLFDANPPHMSGNIFTDFIASYIITSDNPFTHNLSTGEMNQQLIDAMNCDIASLVEIASITQKNIEKWYSIQGQEQGTVAIKNSKSELYSLPAEVVKYRLSTLNYPISSIENSLLVEGYSIICGEGDIANQLSRFYFANGIGQFLNSRVLFAGNQGLNPHGVSGPSQILFDKELNTLCDIIDSFCCNEDYTGVIVVGEAGTGKTRLLNAVTDEFADLHFVFVGDLTAQELASTITTLNRQPVKSVLLMDDATPTAVKAFNQYAQSNLLLIATTADKQLTCYADAVVELPQITLDFAVQAIAKALSRNDIDVIKNICLDYQIETKANLTARGINRLINRLK